jgi:small-conductance mechanosensitive channel
MFARMIDDLKESAGLAVRMTSLAAAIVLMLFITLCFLCAAAFVYVLQTYGPVAACLTGGGIFLILSLIAIAVYVAQQRQARRHAAETARSALQSALTDPMLLTTGLQIIRAIGIKKLVPILAVGGLALGLLANRSRSDEAPAE